MGDAVVYGRKNLVYGLEEVEDGYRDEEKRKKLEEEEEERMAGQEGETR